jgi:hypothetical protein
MTYGCEFNALLLLVGMKTAKRETSLFFCLASSSRPSFPSPPSSARRNAAAAGPVSLLIESLAAAPHLCVLHSPLPLYLLPFPASPTLASASACPPSSSLLHAYKGELYDRPLESHLKRSTRVSSLTLCPLCVRVCLITSDQLCCASTFSSFALSVSSGRIRSTNTVLRALTAIIMTHDILPLLHQHHRHRHPLRSLHSSLILSTLILTSLLSSVRQL